MHLDGHACVHACKPALEQMRIKEPTHTRQRDIKRWGKGARLGTDNIVHSRIENSALENAKGSTSCM